MMSLGGCRDRQILLRIYFNVWIEIAENPEGMTGKGSHIFWDEAEPCP
jgi:hypothetical protein